MTEAAIAKDRFFILAMVDARVQFTFNSCMKYNHFVVEVISVI